MTHERAQGGVVVAKHMQETEPAADSTSSTVVQGAATELHLTAAKKLAQAQHSPPAK